MTEFMIMVLPNEAEEAVLAPSELQALVEGQSAYERTLRAGSAFVDGERLRPSREGKRVSVRAGKSHAVDGPFDATLGAYFVVHADSLDAAVALASECPVSPGTAIEVRPLMKRHTQPDKSHQPGRIFAFAVLGSAPSEEGWIDVMDRIDEATRDGFPGDAWMGGVRLQAPGLGRRVGTTGGRRAVLDGPFLESKEVIGGLFFLRMPSLLDAVGWAQGTAFVTHGALEIRELWRS